MDQAAASAFPATRRPRSLPVPARVNRGRIVMRYAVTVGLYHLVALLALLPWLFSWTGVVVSVLGLYVFGSLGINLYFHRLLTHRGLVVPRWVECILGVIGTCCVQDTPARWVAVHRRHHEHSDQQDDPHSPLVNFFWSHVGWMLVENGDLNRLGIYERYARDIVRDPFQKWLERNYSWIVLAHWIAFFAAGAAASLVGGSTAMQALQFGASLLIWGVFVRTVLVWHISWSVNSLSHLWGYRNYETDEGSRNNMFVALISNGEGWHNNHHADPRSARHGHRWFELDIVYLTIRAMASMGLARNLVVPRQAPAGRKIRPKRHRQVQIAGRVGQVRRVRAERMLLRQDPSPSEDEIRQPPTKLRLSPDSTLSDVAIGEPGGESILLEEGV